MPGGERILSMELILDIMRLSMTEILTLALPLLGTAMVLGLLISIIQATTSIQEQTLTFVPKMVAIIVLLIFLGPMSCTSMMDFTRRLFDLMGNTRL